MQTDVRFSTRFLTTQAAHQVLMLVNLTGRAPNKRAPINVALVLDRSGSMDGMPLEAAKDAAIRFTELLGANDRLSVVVFDDEIQTIFGPAPADSPDAEAAIRQVHAGATTNLSGGWLQGRTHVASGIVDGTNRIVLLTDGQANEGICEVDRLTDLARGGLDQRVSTTCIGFGPYFNEELLEPMAAQGGGNYWYVEEIDQMGGIFDEEIEGLVTLAAQNVSVSVQLTHSGVAGVSFPQAYAIDRTGDGTFVATLGDLYATSPKALAILFHVENVGALGRTELGAVAVTADLVTERGIEHRTTTIPVAVNLDGTDHVVPEVERTFIRFEAAKARRDAVRAADHGDFDAASKVLRQASTKLRELPTSPEVEEEIEDLEAESKRLEERRYDAADRKYHSARADACLSLRAQYAEKISRRRRSSSEQ